MDTVICVYKETDTVQLPASFWEKFISAYKSSQVNICTWHVNQWTPILEYVHNYEKYTFLTVQSQYRPRMVKFH